MKSQSAEIKQEEEVLLETKLCHYFGLNYVGENMQVFNLTVQQIFSTNSRLLSIQQKIY